MNTGKGWLILLFMFLAEGVFAQNTGNLVPNPGFEEGKDSPVPWIIHHMIKGDWAQYSSAEWATDEVHSGKKSIKVSVSKSAGRTLGWRINEEDPIRVKGGKKVRVSGWMKTKEVVMGPTEYDVPSIVFTTYDINKKVVKRYWIGRATSVNTEWTKYEEVIQLKDEVEYFTISAGLTNCTGTAWFDDFDVSYIEDTSFIDILTPALAVKNSEENPIIIPQPYREQYGKQNFFLLTPAIFIEDLQGYEQIQREIKNFLKEISRYDPPMLLSEREIEDYETIILAGKKDSSITGKYLKKLDISVNWKDLGYQGYLLVVKRAEGKNFIILSGNTEQGIYYAVQTLKQYPIKKDSGYQMIEGVIIDRPDYLWRGVVPGGTSLERIDTWMVPLKVNVIYGVPFPGSYEWWQPLGEEYKNNLKEWVEECKKRFIIPVAGERPDRGYVRRIKFSSNEDVNAILQRYRDYYECDIRHFRLSFDDGHPYLEYPEDKEVFKNLAEAHYHLISEVYKLLKNLNSENQLSVVPLHYYNPLEWSPQQREYIKVLSKLPEEVRFVNCSTVTKGTAAEFIKLTGRKPLIWDNWVAQFEEMKPLPALVSPPCTKNEKEIVSYSLGYMFPLLDRQIFWYLASDYMWNASRYNPEESYARVMKKIFGSGVLTNLIEYQQFLQTNYKLPVKGSTAEEMKESIQNLIKGFNYYAEKLKGVIPEELEKEVKATVRNRVEILEKVFLPQIDKKPIPVKIPFATRCPEIDGNIDEDIWRKSVKLTGFSRPVRNEENREIPEHEQTEVLLLYDAQNLYISFICREPSPEKIKARMREPDSEVYLDDCVEVMLAPTGKKEDYYHIVVNPLGTVYDAFLFDKQWSSQAIVKTSVYNDRWIVEIAVPFRNFGVKQVKGSRWYFNLFRARYAGGKPDVTSWAAVENRFHEPERFWVLEFN